jgi:hypothetical protein
VSPLVVALMLAPTPPAANETTSSVEAPAPADAPDPAHLAEPPKENGWSLKLRGSGRAGAGAGTLLVGPYVFAAPGVGMDAKLKWTLYRTLFFDARASLSLGVDDNGAVGVGYRGQASFGWSWFDAGWARLQSRVFLGLSSISVLPVPLPGGGSETKIVFVPVSSDWFRWELEMSGLLEVLIIAPRLGLGVGTGLYFDIWRLTLGIEASAGAEAFVAIVTNYASVAASASAVVVWRF